MTLSIAKAGAGFEDLSCCTGDRIQPKINTVLDRIAHPFKASLRYLKRVAQTLRQILRAGSHCRVLVIDDVG